MDINDNSSIVDRNDARIDPSVPKRLFPWVPLVLAVLLMGSLFGQLYFYAQNQSLKQQLLEAIIVPQQSPSPSYLVETTAPITEERSNWQLYSDYQNAFTIKYPKN